MPDLIALRLPGGPTFVDELRRAFDEGHAVLPIDVRLPEQLTRSLLDTLRPRWIVDVDDPACDRQTLNGHVEVLAGDAVVIATSGSTGVAKGVVHTHDSIAASAAATNAGVGTVPDRDRWLCALPVAHVAGLSVVLRARCSGTPVEVLPGFDPDAVTDAARRGATLTTLVPTALARIDPNLFRRIVVGGTHPPEQLPANCLVSYGLTETGSAVAYDGRPLAGVEVRVDGGGPAEATAGGEILIRGPMLLRAYRGDTPEGRDPRDGDGWFATGDQGSLDATGRLVVHGRRGDLIITGGQNVWPLPVERALATHPDIADLAVIGTPDPTWGEVVTAYVVPTDRTRPPSLDALRDHGRGGLAPYALPRTLVLCDSLPRTTLGKLDRTRLPRP